MEPTIQHLSSITVNQKLKLSALMLAKLVPPPYSGGGQSRSGRGPICLDAETWRSRATNDSPSKWDHRLVEGPPPATPTDCINQHPFSLRRV